MAEPVWGLLEKSQVDNETIEQAIARLIQAHEDDADAHAVAGESLEVHKVQTTVDHPAHSVVRDKMKFDRHIIDEGFRSLDAWDVTGDAIVSGAGLQLATNGDLNDVAQLEMMPNDGTDDIDHLTLDAYAETLLKVSSITHLTAYFGILSAGVSGVGFKIVNGDLFSHYIDEFAAEQNVQIVGITVTDWHRYRIDASVDTNVRLYIDGVLKATIAKADISQAEIFFQYYIKATDAVIRSLFAGSLHYDEDFQS